MVEAGGFVYAGGKQTGSAIELLVEREVEQSYLTRLWNQGSNQAGKNGNFNNLMNKVSQYFTLIILIVAFVSLVYWLVNDPQCALFAFASVLIIACPCALAMTIPFTYGSTLRQFGRSGFYLKNSNVVEKLLKTTTVVFDKTGTLTIIRSAEVNFFGPELSSEKKSAVKSLAFQSTHPVSRIISENLTDVPVYDVEQFVEIPALGISGIVRGIDIKLGSRYFVTGKESTDDLVQTQVWLSVGGKTPGYFQIGNKYREGLTELTADLEKSFDLHLISGDNESERQNLLSFFHKESSLNFNQSPGDKLQYVKNLQAEGKNVLMIGDGLNDAGALAESNVGVIIADDVHNFLPACDVILSADQFGKLNRFIQFTRFSRTIVYLSFIISFIYNLVGLSFAVQGNLSPIIAAILMPLSSVSVIAFATFSVAWAARKSNL
jgi:Cu+-exporting ATPase